jgi:hypothetical protein
MSFTVQMLADAPALLLTLSAEYDLFTDFPKSYQAVSEMLDKASEPVYYIMDVSAAKFDMNVIIQAASSTSQTSQGTFHHPNVKSVLLVSPEEVIHAAAEGLRTDVYGNVRVRTFHKLDDALAYARSNN